MKSFTLTPSLVELQYSLFLLVKNPNNADVKVKSVELTITHKPSGKDMGFIEQKDITFPKHKAKVSVSSLWSL